MKGFFEATYDDRIAQVSSQYIVLSDEGVRLYPVKLRYAWPAELDLMARLAKLTLKERWGSGGKAPFTDESKSHISVYGADQQIDLADNLSREKSNRCKERDRRGGLFLFY